MRKQTRFLAITLALLFSATLNAAPKAKSLSKPATRTATPQTGTRYQVVVNGTKGHSDFHAIGNPSALKIHGKGDAPKGELDIAGNNVSGFLAVKLDSFDTGIKKRNEHMKEKYLEVGKFPEAKLEITKMTLNHGFTGDFKTDNIPFTGKLSMHGVTAPISGTASVEKKGNDVTAEARFSTNVHAFNIAVPSFAGITMADEVQVEAGFTAPVKKK